MLVNCVWNEWNEGECSKQCGGGKRTNTRAPRVNAAYGGKECIGTSSIEESCNTQECPGNIDFSIKSRTSLLTWFYGIYLSLSFIQP